MICVIGLGYVGWPLAEALAKYFPVCGFDIDAEKVKEHGGEIPCFWQWEDVPEEVSTFIICVPTPINDAKQPDLTALVTATKMVGKMLKDFDLVVYESTVYPGCIEDVCMPILDKTKKLIDVGYSPERINPGDTEHTIDRVTKIIACNSDVGLQRMLDIYGRITKVHIAPNIRVAEAAKVIENIQRDVNIALMNEFTMLLHEMNISTSDVLKAARTKWNWLDFKPGLVGGHCISVDPYYLAHAASTLGFHTDMILSGRRINDNMAKFVATEVAKHGCGRVVIMGATFKPDVPDIRNSKVFDLVRYLGAFNIKTHLYDPHVQGIDKPTWPNEIGGIIYAVDHSVFKEEKKNLHKLVRNELGYIFDLTGTIEDADWSL